MSFFALYRPCANWTQQDSRTLIFILRLRRQMDQGLRKFKPYLPRKCRFKYRLRSVIKRGYSSSCDIEHTELEVEAAVREKPAGPLNTPPPRPTLDFTPRGRHLRYLIGQQRAQSSPHSVSKSSAN